MKKLRDNKDILGLIHALRKDLRKDLAGITSPQLYNYCHHGTKVLIEKYHNMVIKCIRKIFYYKGKKVSFPQYLEFFAETRHSYGRTALFLSGN